MLAPYPVGCRKTVVDMAGVASRAYGQRVQVFQNEAKMAWVDVAGEDGTGTDGDTAEGREAQVEARSKKNEWFDQDQSRLSLDENRDGAMGSSCLCVHFVLGRGYPKIQKGSQCQELFRYQLLCHSGLVSKDHHWQ